MSLSAMQGKLSRSEMKQIMAGSFGCGTGISCDGKKSGDTCGSNLCTCEYVPNGGNVLYCRQQL